MGKIEDACKSDQHLRFVHHDVACKVLFDGGFYLHLIPSDMKIVDKIERTVFTTANIFHADRTEYRALRFVNFGKGIRIRVPVLEYTFCMNLNRTIDSNTFSGYTAIMERHLLKPELMSEFFERVPMMGRIARTRLVTLRGLLHRYRPDLSARLPVI